MAEAGVEAIAARYVSPIHCVHSTLSKLAPKQCRYDGQPPVTYLTTRWKDSHLSSSANGGRSSGTQSLRTTASRRGRGKGGSEVSSSSRTDFHKSPTRNCFSRSMPCKIAPSIKRFHTFNRALAEGLQPASCCFPCTNAQSSVHPPSHCAVDMGISAHMCSLISVGPKLAVARGASPISRSPSPSSVSSLRRSYSRSVFSKNRRSENPSGGVCNSSVDPHFAIVVTASLGRFRAPLSPASSSTTLMSAREICPRLGRRMCSELEDWTWRMR